MESKHKNDFVTCRCNKSFLGGGDGLKQVGGRAILIGQDGDATRKDSRKDQSDGK